MTFSLRCPTVLVLLALGAAGCGGDDGGGGQSNDQFVEEANRVCTEGQKRIEAAGADPDRLVSTTEDLVEELKKVEAPSDKADTYDDLVNSYEQFFDAFAAALKAKDVKKIEALDETTGDKEARELGLDACVG